MPKHYFSVHPTTEDIVLQLVEPDSWNDPDGEMDTGGRSFAELLAEEDPTQSCLLHIAAFWGMDRVVARILEAVVAFDPASGGASWDLNRRAVVKQVIGISLSRRIETDRYIARHDPLDHDPMTPLELAQWQGHAEVQDMLLAAGAADHGAVVPLQVDARRAVRARLNAQSLVDYADGYDVAVERHPLPCLRPDALVKEELLGKGCFGGVYRARYTDTPSGEPVTMALKEIALPKSPLEREVIWDEMAAMVNGGSHNQHSVMPSHIQFQGFHVAADGTCVHTLMRLKAGTVRGWVDSLGPETRWTPESDTFIERMRVARQLARGLHVLHSRMVPLVHGDVKTDNALIDTSRGKVGAYVGAQCGMYAVSHT